MDEVLRDGGRSSVCGSFGCHGVVEIPGLPTGRPIHLKIWHESARFGNVTLDGGAQRIERGTMQIQLDAHKWEQGSERGRSEQSQVVEMGIPASAFVAP